MEKHGIDISTYQRNVNYLSLKASNIDFAIIRSGFGKNESQKDNMFEEHYTGLKYVGIPIRSLSLFLFNFKRKCNFRSKKLFKIY